MHNDNYDKQLEAVHEEQGRFIQKIQDEVIVDFQSAVKEAVQKERANVIAYLQQLTQRLHRDADHAQQATAGGASRVIAELAKARAATVESLIKDIQNGSHEQSSKHHDGT